MERGSREYYFLVIGSRTSQSSWRVVCWRKGSILAVSGTGTRSMSDSLMACQPRMEEPSKPKPCSKLWRVSSLIGVVVCCQSPGKSMKRRSTNSTFFCSQSLSTSRGVIEGFSFQRLARARQGDERLEWHRTGGVEQGQSARPLFKSVESV